MAMRKSTRSELNKLRELFWYFIHGKRCAICKEKFVEDDVYTLHRHGDGTGAPLSMRLTIHHKNGDHDDNERSNHGLVHATCHRRYHANKPCTYDWRKGEKGIDLNSGRSRRAA